MPITEVFPSPTVERVIFQIRFPALFSIETRIGDYQLKIMERFPESKIIYRQDIPFLYLGPESKSENPKEDSEHQPVKKIWDFKSEQGVELNVQEDSLSLTSHVHKTYNNPESEHRFRDAIKHAVDNFLEVARIAKITRIGLRYIDNCPVPEKTNQSFSQHYNSAFNLSRFQIENAQKMRFEGIIEKPPHSLRYVETLTAEDGGLKLVLDFDGWGNDIKPTDYLETSDALHNLVSDEYEATIKEPVYRYMRSSGPPS